MTHVAAPHQLLIGQVLMSIKEYYAEPYRGIILPSPFPCGAPHVVALDGN